MNGKTNTKVKGDAESSYRTGNVNLTCANIGAVSTNDVKFTGTTTGVEFDTWTTDPPKANIVWKLNNGWKTRIQVSPQVSKPCIYYDVYNASGTLTWSRVIYFA